MAKNRFNVVRQPTPDFTPKKKQEEVVLIFSPCCVCGKVITVGYYARWNDGGVCSGKCNREMEAQRVKFLSSS